LRVFVLEKAMANLTISVDDKVLKQARIRALEENTSVNAILGKRLEEYAQLDDVRRRLLAARQRVIDLSDAPTIERGTTPWNRDALYER